MLNCHTKTKFKRSSFSKEVLCKRIKQSDCPGKLWGTGFSMKGCWGLPSLLISKKKTSHICTKTDNLWPWKFPACRKYSLSATRDLEIPPSCNVVGEVSLLTRPQWKTLRFRLYSTGNQVDPYPYEKKLASLLSPVLVACRPNLDLLCFRQSNAAHFCKKYTKIYLM